MERISSTVANVRWHNRAVGIFTPAELPWYEAVEAQEPRSDGFLGLEHLIRMNVAGGENADEP
jgi:hypothetical protein